MDAQEELILVDLTENTSVRQVSISSGPCGGTVFSNVITVEVFEQVAAGEISEDQSICHDASPAPISALAATGGSSNFSYQWQSALPGSRWTNISNANALVHQSTPLIESTAFRLLVSDNGGCGVVYTEPMMVNVADPLVAGTMSIEQDSICFGGQFNASATETTGGLGAILYDWSLSVDSSAFQSVNLNSLSWQAEEIEADFVEVVLTSTSSGGCGSVQSNVVYVEVLSPLAAPVIEFIDFNADSILCFGETSPSLQLLDEASGADGQWSYSWQTASGNGIWSTIQSDSSFFSPGSADGSFEIRMEASSEFGCGQVTSNVLDITTYDIEIAPVVNLELGDFEICFETSPGSIETESSPSGGSENWTYQWQVLEDDSWLPLEGDTLNETFIPPLVESQSYRLQAQDSICATVHSNVIDIVVFEPLDDALNIETSTTQTLCDSNDGVVVELAPLPSGGGDDFTYAWFEQGAQIPLETGTSLDVLFVEDTTSYSLVATSTQGCGTIASNIVEVNVYDALGAFEATENQLICNGFSPEIISSLGGYGASGSYFYQWQENLGSAWNSIPGEQGTLLALSDLTNSGLYRIQVTDAAGCGTVVSNEVSIQVLPPFNPGMVTSSLDVLCHEESFTISGEAATGADGDIEDVWMVSINGEPFEEAEYSSLEWTVNSSTSDYLVYLESTSGFGCGTVASNTVEVQTLDPIVPPSVDFVDYDFTTLCFGDDAPELEVINLAEGADGNWEYTWESTSNGSVWLANQASSENFSAGALAQSSSFRLRSESTFGCGTFYSNQLDVSVHAALTYPFVSLASNDFGICHNTSPGNMSLFIPSTGGSGDWSYQWEVNENGSWSEIDGETGLNYTPCPDGKSVVQNCGDRVPVWNSEFIPHRYRSF